MLKHTVRVCDMKQSHVFVTRKIKLEKLKTCQLSTCMYSKAMALVLVCRNSNDSTVEVR